MKKLCMYLPPFAPDYSGVCSALFELNGLVVIHDAAGCTGNYTGFDEPRWYGSQKAVYCSGLRKIDVVMGNEQKFYDRISAAAKSRRPDFIAVVGSPVPMVIGTDFEGFGAELESITGIPAFGFAANGTRLYHEGAAEACIALIDRYARQPGKKHENRVNILGATPLDITPSNLADMRKLLENNGYKVGACFSMGITLEQIEHAGESALNIAVSQAGVLIAEHMKEKFGTPYATGLPIGARGAQDWLGRIRGVRAEEENSGAAPVIVVGDAVSAYSISSALKKDFGIGADTATPFSGKGNPRRGQTIEMEYEEEVIELVNNEKYRLVIADPLINQLIRNRKEKRHIDLAHYAISSKFYTHCADDYIADNFNKNFGKEVLK